MYILFAVAAVAVILWYLVHPAANHERMRRWRGRKFAHRGLHRPSRGIVENTLPAFEAACRAGYGIELDIQFSADGQVVVFHDDTLGRLTGDPRRVRAVALQELRAMPLGGVESARIPTLDETLALVNGRAPLLIELKTGRENRLLCEALMEKLASYPGEYIVESFNPMIVAWFRRNAPEVPRGQLVCSFGGYLRTVGPLAAIPLASLCLNVVARPDFVAYDARAPFFLAPRVQRLLFHTPLAAWTVRTKALAEKVLSRGEMCIFEEIDP